MPRSRHDGKVVIVDADAVNRQLLTDVLAREGYEIGQYEAALRRGEQPEFAIINLDVLSGPLDNRLNIARRVRVSWPTTHVVLISTALPRPSIAKEFEHYIWMLAPGNFVDAVLARLDELGGERPRRPCFVIMPFSTGNGSDKDTWTALFETIIRPAVEKSGRYRCSRADPPAGDILGQLISDLLTAEVVIADLTAGKPNVLYELGLRHAEGGITVLISQDKLPFDLGADACISYSPTNDGLEKLRQSLESRIAELGQEIDKNRQDNYVPHVSTYVQTYRKKLRESGHA